MRGRQPCLLGAFYVLVMLTPALQRAQSSVVPTREGYSREAACLDSLYPYRIIRRRSIHIFPALMPHFWGFLASREVDACIWSGNLSIGLYSLQVNSDTDGSAREATIQVPRGFIPSVGDPV